MLVNTLIVLDDSKNHTPLEYYRNFDEKHKSLQETIVNRLRQSHLTKIVDMINTFRISKNEFD